MEDYSQLIAAMKPVWEHHGFNPDETARLWISLKTSGKVTMGCFLGEVEKEATRRGWVKEVSDLLESKEFFIDYYEEAPFYEDCVMEAVAAPGSNEGIYVDFVCRWYDEQTHEHKRKVAGCVKSLDTSLDAMARLGAFAGKITWLAYQMADMFPW